MKQKKRLIIEWILHVLLVIVLLSICVLTACFQDKEIIIPEEEYQSIAQAMLDRP